jgi:hypothetical protein
MRPNPATTGNSARWRRTHEVETFMNSAVSFVAAGTGIAVLAANVLSWLWGVLHFSTRGPMPDKAHQQRRANRVYKSPHKDGKTGMMESNSFFAVGLP